MALISTYQYIDFGRSLYYLNEKVPYGFPSAYIGYGSLQSECTSVFLYMIVDVIAMAYKLRQ